MKRARAVASDDILPVRAAALGKGGSRFGQRRNRRRSFAQPCSDAYRCGDSPPLSAAGIQAQAALAGVRNQKCLKPVPLLMSG